MIIQYYKNNTFELLEEFEESSRYALYSIEMIDGAAKELAEIESSYLLNKTLNKYYEYKKYG